jgi:hypothetical protein
MAMRLINRFLATMAGMLLLAAPALADYFLFTTGDPDGRLGAAIRVETENQIEIESADDFVLTRETILWHAGFRGLLPSTSDLSDIQTVVVEIYRIFPLDSDTERTIQVPTRMNSPSDVAFLERESFEGELIFDVTLVNPYSGVDNSVVDNLAVGAGGEGAVAGQDVQIDVYFQLPINLPPGHYFFVPQVGLASERTFLWLSAPHPQFTGDLQMWIRNSNLDPDWLRVGADIIGGTTFNGSFILEGETIP